jgi:hypothetical protein
MKRNAAIKILEANEFFFSGMEPIMIFLYTAHQGKKIAFPRHTEYSDKFIKMLLKEKPE